MYTVKASELWEEDKGDDLEGCIGGGQVKGREALLFESKMNTCPYPAVKTQRWVIPMGNWDVKYALLMIYLVVVMCTVISFTKSTALVLNRVVSKACVHWDLQEILSSVLAVNLKLF